MKNKALAVLAAAGTLCASLTAQAHVSVASGPAYANKSGIIELGVGHGCDGTDTYSITVDIPAGVTSVRPMWSDFGKTSMTHDAVDPTLVTSVTWQKDVADALDGDTNYYKLAIRAKAPNTPFTTLYFKAHQTCRAADATLSEVEWIALPGEEGEPAAALNILPARLPGWNKFTVPVDVADPSVFFQDAVIVWRGSEAYSFNEATVELINTTAGASLLSGGLLANDEVWVRY